MSLTAMAVLMVMAVMMIVIVMVFVLLLLLLSPVPVTSRHLCNQLQRLQLPGGAFRSGSVNTPMID